MVSVYVVCTWLNITCAAFGQAGSQAVRQPAWIVGGADFPPFHSHYPTVTYLRLG